MGKGKSPEVSANKDKSADVNTGKNRGSTGPRGIGAGRKLANATTDRISQYRNNWTGYWARHPITGTAITAGAPFYWAKKGLSALGKKIGSNEWGVLGTLGLLGATIPTINGYNLWDAKANGLIDFESLNRAYLASQYTDEGKPVDPAFAANQTGSPFFRVGNNDIYNGALSYMKRVRDDASDAADKYFPALFNALAPGAFKGGQPENLDEVDFAKTIPGYGEGMTPYDRDANRMADMLLAMQYLAEHGTPQQRTDITSLNNNEAMWDTDRENVLRQLPQVFKDLQKSKINDMKGSSLFMNPAANLLNAQLQKDAAAKAKQSASSNDDDPFEGLY